MELSKGCLGLLLHSVEIPLQAISWVDLKELEELLESVVGVWQVTYKARSVSSIYGANYYYYYILIIPITGTVLPRSHTQKGNNHKHTKQLH